MSLVYSPIPVPTYLGNALQMEPEEWLSVNAIHLRERWRELLDSCLLLRLDFPDETDYIDYCRAQLDTECTRLKHWEDAP